MSQVSLYSSPQIDFDYHPIIRIASSFQAKQKRVCGIEKRWCFRITLLWRLQLTLLSGNAGLD
jgi:hypothetical protein